jgi:hypothetical protein
MHPVATAGGVFSDMMANSSAFLTTLKHKSRMSRLKLSLDPKRWIKSHALVLSNSSFNISWNLLQLFVITLPVKLNIFAISFALRGT